MGAKWVIGMILGLPLSPASAGEWERFLDEPSAAHARAINGGFTDDRTQYDDALAILENEVLAGNREVVRLVFRLVGETDGALKLELSQLLGRLIRVEPALFLDELKRAGVGRIDSIVGSCGVAFVDRFRAQRHEEGRRLAALVTVGDPELAAVRERCLAELRRQLIRLDRVIARTDPDDFPLSDPAPSGRWVAFRSYEAPEAPSSFVLRILEAETGRDLGQVPIIGRFNHKTDHWSEILLWHPEHDAFAYEDPVHRRGNRIRFFAIEAGAVREWPLPDHVATFCRKFGSDGGGRIDISSLEEWDGDRLRLGCLVSPSGFPDETHGYRAVLGIRRDPGDGTWQAELEELSEPENE